MKNTYNPEEEENYKEVSPSKFFYSSKFFRELGADPTYDWKVLKEYRLATSFEDYKKLVNDANIKNEVATESENTLYSNWLGKEINYYNQMILGHSKIPQNRQEEALKSLFEADILQFKKYISYLEQEKDKLSKAISKNQKTKNSYIWQGNLDKELPELYSLMIGKYKLIASETKYEHFKAVFKGQPIESIEPIKWHQENASELLYFIERLGQSNNIDFNPKKSDYQKMTSCFVKPNGKEFKAAWKSLKTNLEITLSPEKQKAIDELLKDF